MTCINLMVINLLRGIETKLHESFCSDVKVCLLSLCSYSQWKQWQILQCCKGKQAQSVVFFVNSA